MRLPEWFKQYVLGGLRRIDETDLRWSYIVIGGMVAVGTVVNVILPHGWTVWPFVLAAGLMMLVHEAAERNADGVPPLHVYALCGSALTAWLVLVFVLSVVNPLIELMGLLAVGYFVARGIVRQRRKMQVIEARRLDGLCIHCGEPLERGYECCMNCGEESEPDEHRLKRVAEAAQSLKRTERLRAMLTPAPPTADVARKEKALLARRQRGQGRNKRGK